MSVAQDSLIMSKYRDIYLSTDSDSVRLELLINILNSTELSDIDTAISLSKEAIRLSELRKDSLYLAFAKQSLASFYSVQSNHNEALRNDLEALSIIKNSKYKILLPSILNAVGEDYLNLDLFNEAFDYYRQCLDVAQEQGDTLQVAVSTYNIGRVLFAMGQYDRAEKYFLESMEYSGSVDDSAGIAYSKHDLALIYLENKEYERALKELNQAYEISVSQNEDVLVPQVLASTAKTFERSNNFQQALNYYDKALDLYEDQGNKNGIGEVFFGKGTVSLRMGDDVGARVYFEKCVEMAGSIDDNELLIKCYESLSKLYESENNLKQALEFYKKFKELEDSVFSEKKKEQFSQVQIQYETAKKDIEIQLLNQKEKQQITQLRNQEFIRNILVVILAFTAVLLFSLYKNNEKRRKINEVLVRQQKEIESKSKELSSLLEMKDKFFSIVSHDLRSPINALVGILELLDEGNMTQKELKEVSHALRLRLDNTRKLLDTLLDWAMMQMNEIKINTEELNLSEIADQNFKFFKEIDEKKIDFINELEKNTLVKADKNMLDLIIRNLISNAIKFTNDGGEIKIYSEQGPKKSLIVMVEDNGVGMTPEQMDKLFDSSELYTTRGTANEKGTGLGLRLCKEFVERMGGNIWVESTEGKGSIFKFTINRA